MVKVVGYVEKFRIGETQKEEHRAQSIEKTNSDENRKNGKCQIENRHPGRRQDGNRADAPVVEEKRWRFVELSYPARQDETQQAGAHNDSEEKPDYCEAGAVDWVI